MSRIVRVKTVSPRASKETLQGDWLTRLRLAVEMNSELDRIIASAEGRAA